MAPPASKGAPVTVLVEHVQAVGVLDLDQAIVLVLIADELVRPLEVRGLFGRDAAVGVVGVFREAGVGVWRRGSCRGRPCRIPWSGARDR